MHTWNDIRDPEIVEIGTALLDLEPKGVWEPMVNEIFDKLGRESPEALRGFICGMQAAAAMADLNRADLPNLFTMLAIALTITPEAEAAQKLWEGGHVRSFDP